MELSQGIRRMGFRRWYERQLIESHLYLVSGVLALFMAIACYEGFGSVPASEFVFRIVAMMAGIMVCLWTFRRYLNMLAVAEHAAEHSVCEKCGTYRGLDLAARALSPGPVEEGELMPVGVRCRKCGHEWIIR